MPSKIRDADYGIRWRCRRPTRRGSFAAYRKVAVTLVSACGLPTYAAPPRVTSQCPYVEVKACASREARHFLSAWAARHPKGSQELLDVSGDFIAEFNERMLEHVYAREFPLSSAWQTQCTSAYLLSLYAASRGSQLHSWVVYEVGFSIIASCKYDEVLFFSVFGVTPTQIAYALFMLSHSTMFPFHLGNPWNPAARAALEPAQAAEHLHATSWRIDNRPPLVIDIGMGLGADTRYYLSQGFNVVAVEANSASIKQALDDEWTKHFTEAGQLLVLHTAIQAANESGGVTQFYASADRAEQSRTVLMEDKAELEAVKTVDCSTLLQTYGRPVYMKIDVEEQTVDCLQSMYDSWKRKHAVDADFEAREGTFLPASLSFEVEDTGHLDRLVSQLGEMGYAYYKVVRQSQYSPNSCELGIEERKVLGCGSGPFGEAAVDYLRGPLWNELSELSEDRHWELDYSSSRDWFDIHVKLRE
eukprot:TRINITY_DN21002_c0_g1_i1.p1 TRINITY_DN21002_c0_g1~~TRINITY_DN21002_c0_g1_i1.p1  ORF type:complete len:473 (-),score=65.39 TRINITY_DN21002_c0_g1_i1:26-1444(-)